MKITTQKALIKALSAYSHISLKKYSIKKRTKLKF